MTLGESLSNPFAPTEFLPLKKGEPERVLPTGYAVPKPSIQDKHLHIRERILPLKENVQL
jgi:hypothetical protein